MKTHDPSKLIKIPIMLGRNTSTIVVIKICLEENDKVDDIYRIETS